MNRKTSLPKRIQSLAVVIAFVVTNHFNLPVFAASTSLDQNLNRGESTHAHFPSDLSKITVPVEIGKIQEISQSAGEKAVILIQDAHAIPDAQRNIQRLIDHFQKEYGLNLIALEGAQSKLDPQIFRSFPDKDILKQTFESYFAKGELTGTTAAAVFSPSPSPSPLGRGKKGEGQTIFHGIEDWPLYEEGLALYLQAARKDGEIFEKIQVLKERLEKEKEKAYSQELFELDQALVRFHENHLDLVSVLKQLSKILKPKEGTELALLVEEAERDEQNFTPIEIEVKKIAKRVRSSLRAKRSNPRSEIPSPTAPPRNDGLRMFNQKSQEFQTSHLAPEGFALFLKELAMKNNLPFEISDSLSHRMQNHKRMKDIEGTKLFQEFEKYAARAKANLFRNEKEKALDQETRKLYLLEKLARLELTKENWNEFNQSVSHEQGHISLLNRLRFHIGFYRNAEKRDRIFFKNLIALMEHHRAHSSLLVTGGFHTEGLIQQFKEKGVSYLLITPQIGLIPEHSLYREHMKGEVSWQGYLETENGKVNLYKAFVRAVRDKLLT